MEKKTFILTGIFLLTWFLSGVELGKNHYVSWAVLFGLSIYLAYRMGED